MFPIPQVSFKRKHYKWTYEEDKKLKELLKDCKDKPNWEEISSKFINRNPRQCQERWSYYLSPEVNNGPWSPEEDELLLKKYKEFGTKWVNIAQFFKGRTNTNCKNRFLAIQRAVSKGEELPVLKKMEFPSHGGSEPETTSYDPDVSFEQDFGIYESSFGQDIFMDEFSW